MIGRSQYQCKLECWGSGRHQGQPATRALTAPPATRGVSHSIYRCRGRSRNHPRFRAIDKRSRHLLRDRSRESAMPGHSADGLDGRSTRRGTRASPHSRRTHFCHHPLPHARHEVGDFGYLDHVSGVGDYDDVRARSEEVQIGSMRLYTISLEALQSLRDEGVPPA